MDDISRPANPTAPDADDELALVDHASDVGHEDLDPRRWLTLIILIATVVLIAVDTSVLNVSIPTMLRELDTTVPALQWVITGYSLTFASLLIVGGRLGDIYGHRRLFVIGASLFGIGSLIASSAQSVGMLIVGEAVIEGIGAALMTPATLAILSTTFAGRERAKAFALWGAAAGAAVAFGPVIGGYLTTEHSWRWAFRVNVVVAPIAVLGAMLWMRKGQRQARTPIDIPGALLISSGMLLLVFALSSGGQYGWFHSIQGFSVGSVEVWPASWPVSVVPVTVLVAVALLVSFVVLERSKERRNAYPLFEFSQLRFKTFRYGLLTLIVLAMGQLGLLLALPIFLQNAVHLTALENGLWLLPLGIFVVIGSQVGGRLIQVIGTTMVVRIGLITEAIGMLFVILAVSPGITFWQVFPGLAVFGIGLGFASSQLVSVILSEIPSEKSGVAGGANSTARQLGAALGAAVIGSLITVHTTNAGVDAVRSTPGLSASVRDQAIAGFQQAGPSFAPPSGISAVDAATLGHVLTQSLAEATRVALGFAAFLVFLGAVVSMLIPRNKVDGIADGADGRPSDGIEVLESLDPLDPLDPDLAVRKDGDSPVLA